VWCCKKTISPVYMKHWVREIDREYRTITRWKWLRLKFNDRSCSLLSWTYLSLYVVRCESQKQNLLCTWVSMLRCMDVSVVVDVWMCVWMDVYKLRRLIAMLWYSLNLFQLLSMYTLYLIMYVDMRTPFNT